MEDLAKELVLKSLIAEIDKKLEELGEHEITRSLELRKKKAYYLYFLTGEQRYAFEQLELYDQLEQRLSIFCAASYDDLE